MRKKKRERQALLNELLAGNPFLTDEELAVHFSVSIQTIRLDRMEQNIPELRARIKDVAFKHRDAVISLTPEEVFGEIIDLVLEQQAISIFEVGQDHVFTRSGIARGHHLFAQANSLAVALMNNEFVLTAKAEIQFKRPVYSGERVVAKAEVIRDAGERMRVVVNSRVNQELVFQGEFAMYKQIESVEDEDGQL
ncbi:transcription factor FapR [Shouchella patagoniensis]|uniref:transcription factor FapR n=1 Tax=Shouchella patagoniensis TaxID=228576 RepID=UPI000994DBB4|nr:transcription factor FapR [Shouchella patagoniensis]